MPDSRLGTKPRSPESTRALIRQAQAGDTAAMDDLSVGVA